MIQGLTYCLTHGSLHGICYQLKKCNNISLFFGCGLGVGGSMRPVVQVAEKKKSFQRWPSAVLANHFGGKLTRQVYLSSASEVLLRGWIIAFSLSLSRERENQTEAERKLVNQRKRPNVVSVLKCGLSAPSSFVLILWVGKERIIHPPLCRLPVGQF